MITFFIFLSFSGGLELHVNNYLSRVQTKFGENELKCDFEEGKVERFGFTLETLDLPARLTLRVFLSYFVTLKYCKGSRFKWNFSWFYQRSQTVLGCIVNHHGPTCANYMKMMSKNSGIFGRVPPFFTQNGSKWTSKDNLALQGPHVHIYTEWM